MSNVNGDLSDLLRVSSADAAPLPDGTSSSWSQRTSTAAALAQNVRLGARDGLNLTLVNVLIYHRPSVGDGGFVYGSTTGRLQVPLIPSTDLFAEGGGGYMGYAFGAVGVHTWLDGRGDPGSFGVSVAPGGAAVWGSREIETTTLTGDRYYSRKTVTVAPTPRATSPSHASIAQRTTASPAPVPVGRVVPSSTRGLKVRRNSRGTSRPIRTSREHLRAEPRRPVRSLHEGVAARTREEKRGLEPTLDDRVDRPDEHLVLRACDREGRARPREPIGELLHASIEVVVDEVNDAGTRDLAESPLDATTTLS